MPFETGTIIAVAAALLFYLRLIILQRQRAKQAQNTSKQARKTSLPAPAPGLLVIRSGLLVGAGVFLIGAGAVFSVVPWFASFGPIWWWVPVTLGILLMGLGVG